MSDSAISINNLIKTYANGTKALTGASLEVKAGDFFALLGANGAGKTTLIGILTGLVTKTSGQVKVFDIDIERDHSAAKRLMGVVPQEFNFNMFETVQDIILAQAGYYGIPRHEALPYCEELLKMLELSGKKKTASRMLSGGMKRRLMIARALITKPKLLILDEPTAGVDVELRYGMWEFLKELNRQGTTILLTTHYLEEVEQMCRNAAIIKSGAIVKNDQVKNLVRLIDEESYVVHVDKTVDQAQLQFIKGIRIDDNTFEVELNKTDKLNDVMAKIAAQGLQVLDLRPKGNRLEKLFLKLLKQ